MYRWSARTTTNEQLVIICLQIIRRSEKFHFQFLWCGFSIIPTAQCARGVAYLMGSSESNIKIWERGVISFVKSINQWGEDVSNWYMYVLFKPHKISVENWSCLASLLRVPLYSQYNVNSMTEHQTDQGSRNHIWIEYACRRS